MSAKESAPPPHPADDSAVVRPGELLAGKYEVRRVVGHGGMGVVVLARHVGLDTSVAVKIMRCAAAEDPTEVARFAREARAAVKLKGEHVAQVLDVGRTERGLPFLVMEYLEGRDLGSFRRPEQRLTPTEVAEYVIQACDALAEAHCCGIVHRDIKPENLFVTERNGWRSIKVTGCFDQTHPDFVPRSPPAAGRRPTDDGFFDPSATYVGAFRDENDDWATGEWVRWGP